MMARQVQRGLWAQRAPKGRREHRGLRALRESRDRQDHRVRWDPKGHEVLPAQRGLQASRFFGWAVWGNHLRRRR